MSNSNSLDLQTRAAAARLVSAMRETNAALIAAVVNERAAIAADRVSAALAEARRQAAMLSRGSRVVSRSSTRGALERAAMFL